MTVSGADMGKFSYNPPAGFEGTDTFTYTLSDSATDKGSAAANRTATVSIPVSGMVWFINNNATACVVAGCGRLSNPFSTLAAFQTLNDNGGGNHPGNSDNIFIYESATAYADGVTLLSGEKLFGQDSTSSLATLTGLTPPSGSASFPTMNTGGNATTIANNTGNGVTLPSSGNNTLNGFTVGDTSGYDIANTTTTSVGTLTIANVILTGTGGLFRADAGGALNVTFDSASTTLTNATINGIQLANTTGSFTVNGSGSVSGVAGTGVLISGGTATVSIASSLSKTAAGTLVDIQSHATGNITLSNNLSCTSSCSKGVNAASNTSGTIDFGGGTKTINTGTNNAVTLTSNTGATLNFSNGGLNIDTTSGNGFAATSGGTVNVTGTVNTIDSTTGTALNVANTTIGASGLTFQSISANGGSHGIVLDTTGATAGLTVTGTGTANSGGTIQAISGADLASNNCGSVATPGGPVGGGIFLNSTKNPSFSYMNFTGTFGNFGILGYSVTGFTLDHTTMTGTFGDNVNVDDDTVHFCGLTGSATISNSTISNGAETNLRVVNASGTLNRLTLQSDTFGLNQTNGGGGTLVEADGGTTNVTVLDSTFQGSRGTPFNALSQTGATMDLVFGQPGHGNTIHNTHPNIVPFAQDLAVTPTGTETFDINSNHFDSASAVQAQGGVIINAALGTATATGYFRNNTIGNSGVANSGSSGDMPALDVESNGGGRPYNGNNHK